MNTAKDQNTLSAPALAAAKGADAILSKKQVAAMVDREEFEKPRQLSPRRVGWLLSTVQAWIASRPQRAA